MFKRQPVPDQQIAKQRDMEDATQNGAGGASKKAPRSIFHSIDDDTPARCRVAENLHEGARKRQIDFSPSPSDKHRDKRTSDGAAAGKDDEGIDVEDAPDDDRKALNIIRQAMGVPQKGIVKEYGKKIAKLESTAGRLGVNVNSMGDNLANLTETLMEMMKMEKGRTETQHQHDAKLKEAIEMVNNMVQQYNEYGTRKTRFATSSTNAEQSRYR